MTSLMNAVASLLAVSVVALGACGCGGESGNDLSTPPITVLPLPVADAGYGCPGNAGCACSESVPCARKTICTDGICVYPIEPCGNCVSHGMN